MDKFRKIVQIFSAVIGNANINGLLNGTIYRGKLKSVCFPGLNCYSCPAAVGACPLGSLQALIMAPAYVLGFLMMVGVFLGRAVCGFVCPFGLFQELLHLIPSKKIGISFKYLKLKYAILLIFVIILPMYSFIVNGYSVPAFCKYICPSGTIFAGLPLMAANESLRLAAGGLFLLKAVIAVIIIAASIITIRPFCRFICPLGLIFGFFNKYSIVKMYKTGNCIKCGKCEKTCEIFGGGNLNSPECIRCMKCAKGCSVGAIKLGIRESNENC